MNAGSRQKKLHRKPERGMHADQRGFSLLEVLIAMFVLAIIAIPICRVYVSAARTNAKARKQAGATAVAENIMEGCNAFSYEDIARQFDPAQTDNADFLICRIPTDRNDKAPEAGKPAVRALSSGDPADGGVLVYTLRGVEEDAYTFDVRVTIDPTKYSREDESDPLLANDYELISMTGYNAEKDYMFVEGENALRQSCMDHGFSYDEVADSIKREMVVTVDAVDDDADGANDYVIVSMVINYEIVGAGVTWADTSLGARQYMTEELLRNCYLCYLPNYAASNAGRSQYDTITIHNGDNVPFHLYLIKQSNSVDPALENHEDHYAPAVNIYEGQWAADGQGSYLTLHTNYKTNLARIRDDDETNDEVYGGIGPVYGYRYLDADSGTPVDRSGDDDAVGDVLIMTDSAVNTRQANRMFHVTVEIYESGACDENFSGASADRVTTLSSFGGVSPTPGA